MSAPIPESLQPATWARVTEGTAVRCLRDLATAVAEITHATGVNVTLSVFRAGYVPGAAAAELPARIEVHVGESTICGETVAEILEKAPRHKQDLFNRIQRTRDELQRLEAEGAGAAPGKEWP